MKQRHSAIGSRDLGSSSKPERPRLDPSGKPGDAVRPYHLSRTTAKAPRTSWRGTTAGPSRLTITLFVLVIVWLTVYLLRG